MDLYKISEDSNKECLLPQLREQDFNTKISEHNFDFKQKIVMDLDDL